VPSCRGNAYLFRERKRFLCSAGPFHSLPCIREKSISDIGVREERKWDYSFSKGRGRIWLCHWKETTWLGTRKGGIKTVLTWGRSTLKEKKSKSFNFRQLKRGGREAAVPLIWKDRAGLFQKGGGGGISTVGYMRGCDRYCLPMCDKD